MQVTSFIPAAPHSSGPVASPGRQSEPREGFDSVYEERAPQPSETARDRTSEDSAVRRRPDAKETEEPKRTEDIKRTDGSDRNDTDEGKDASADEPDAGGVPEASDVGPADKTQEAEGEDMTAAGEVPDEAAVAAAEAPARQAPRRSPDGTESQRATSAVGEKIPQAPSTATETPAASVEAEPVEPAKAVPERTASPAAATEIAQARTAVRPSGAEEVQVRRVRADRAEAIPEGAEPRIEAAPRDVEVKAPKAPAASAMPDAFAPPAADRAVPLAADPALAEVGAADVRTTAEHVARAEATVRHDTPRPVMQQMAEAARALRDGPVELTLQPEELGKVRMTLTAGPDGNMTMSLQAERSETLDLLRRHIGDLARELQDLGFSNLNFSFGQDGARPGQDHPAGGFEGDEGERPVTAVPLSGAGLATRPNMAPVAGGLDLRL